MALTGLVVKEEHQADLFDKPKNAKLVQAIDAVNQKFGKGALIYGDAAPDQTSRSPFSACPRRRSCESSGGQRRRIGAQQRQSEMHAGVLHG